MEFLPEQSELSAYAAYQHENGDVYLVMNGLDPNQLHTPYGIEAFILANYDLFALAYTGLLITTLLFVSCTYVLIPAYLRWRNGLPVFEAQ